jgi:DNA mismatch repair protein MutS2
LLNGRESVEIVHGKGTGALRQAVHEALARHPQIHEFSPAEPTQGGDGLTIATLV